MTLLLLPLLALPVHLPEFCPLERVVGPAGSELGRSVALEGDTLAVGVPAEGDGTGAVRIYDVSSGEPELVQTLAGASFDFGASLSLDGDTLAVGAPYDGGFVGRVYVFERDGLVWSETEVVLPPNPSMFEFGLHVALTDEFLIARGQKNSIRYVFAFRREDLSYPVFATDSLGLSFTSGGFGRSLAASGSDLVIGYPFGARVVDLTTQSVQEITGSIEFGRSVTIDGDRLAIGESSLPLGRVHVYVRGAEGFEPEAIVDSIAPINIGWRVELEGDQLLTAGLVESSVQLFRRGAGGWKFRKSVTLPFAATSSVNSALDLDGPRFAVGVSNEFEPSTYLRLDDGPCFSATGGEGEAFEPWENDFGLWSVQPATIPSVSVGGSATVTVYGINLGDVAQVAINGVALPDWTVLNNSAVAVEVPPQPELGPAQLVLTSLWGSKRSIELRVVAAEPPALALADSELTLGGEPGRVAFLFASLVGVPSVFPGVASLAIGAGGTALVPLGAHVIGAGGWSQLALGLPALASGTVQLQAAVYDPVTGALPVSVTNVAP